jgi:hypothetical protein
MFLDSRRGVLRSIKSAAAQIQKRVGAGTVAANHPKYGRHSEAKRGERTEPASPFLTPRTQVLDDEYDALAAAAKI